MALHNISTREYAPLFVRLGVGFVFLLLGIQQFLFTEQWTTWLPHWLTQALPDAAPAMHVILVNASIDVLLGLALLLGIFTRIVAILMVIHLVGVLLTLGYNDIAIRDLGILLAAIAVAIHGADRWCLEMRWKKHTASKEDKS